MGGRKKVMIVDDSKLIRMTVKKTLEYHGIQVAELDCVETLLEEPWRTQDLDLLILDINLPGMDGISALRLMQEDPELKKLPVMIMTAYSECHNVHNAIKSGAVEFVIKPFVSEDLIERVENIIGPLQDDIRDCVFDEINRAKRGNTPLSIIKISFTKPPAISVARKIQQLLQEMLRRIDSVLISEENCLVAVLPITGEEGCLLVNEKISKALEEGADIPTGFAISCAFFTKEDDNADELLELLKIRNPKAQKMTDRCYVTSI